MKKTISCYRKSTILQKTFCTLKQFQKIKVEGKHFSRTLQRENMLKLIPINFGIAVLLSITLTTNVLGEEKVPEKEPAVSAQGAALMDYKTGRILWSKNETTPMAMASTTKIMTAIVALENGNLSDMVTVSKRAASAPDIQMKLQAGEQVSLESLLYALMLVSYNDAAVAVAEHVGGSVENFCAMMTEKARSIGATDTIFETPNGLDKGEHHSTARDMAIITRYAMANKKFVDIINTPSIVITSNRQTYDLQNRNRLLREFEGANGVKTGFTGKAGHCFVGSAKRGDMQLISVVFASGWGDKGKAQKWVDTKEILSYGFNNFEYKNIVNANDSADSVKIERSKTDTIPLYFSEGLMLPLRKDEAEKLSVSKEIPPSVMAPVEKGQTLGVAKVIVGDKVIKEIPLLAAGSAERHDLKTSMEKVINEWLEMGTSGDVKVILPEF